MLITMRSVVLATLFGAVVSQSNSFNITSALGSPTTTSGTSAVTSQISTGSKTAITVAADGSSQFTAINAAIYAAQNSGIATVTVLPGTYTEAVTVSGTATVTIVGATATAAADWSQNQVTISNPSAALTIGSNSAKGVTVRNINFVNSAPPSGGQAIVIFLRGSNTAFYGCSIVSTGQTPISVSTGTTFIANSYIEGTDKLFYNYPTIYVYNSTIVPLNTGANIIFNKGLTSGGLNPVLIANSTVVFDSSTIQQKPGYTNTGVYLAAPGSAGAVGIFRNTAMGAFMSPAGVHQTADGKTSFFGEFLCTGAGSSTQNAAVRSPFDVALTVDQVSQFTVDKIFGNTVPQYASTSLDWLDPAILALLQASDEAQIAAAAPPVTSVGSVSTMSSQLANSTVAPSISPPAAMLSSSAVLASATGLFNLTITSSSITTPTLVASICPTPSATLVVSKNPGPCEFGNITAAINAMPNNGNNYTILIGAGTYVEQLSITRKGKVTLVGATNYTNDYTHNQVRVETSNGRLTGLSQNEQTPVVYAKKTNDNSGLAIHNIDFVNTYPQTANTAALAADFYGANIAAYGCSFVGFQDTLLANKGTQVFSNCYIEGSVDFVWGFSTAYFHQCMVVSNTPGSCIAAQSRLDASTPGGYVFDSCMVTYSSTYGSSFGLSFLGRPYSAFSIAVYMNSYIDKHISADGWQVWSTSNPQTSGVLFGEFNNSGPGSWQTNTKRVSFATNLTAAQASKYDLAAWIGDTTWLDMTAYNARPSFDLTGLSPDLPTTNGTTPSSITTAKVNAHPDSGTVPPSGAVVVSVDGSHNAAYINLTSALASLPKDSTNQTVFLYPGSYNEQIPSVNRPGAVRIIGYTNGNPGQSYKDNMVTITYSRGLSISPLPAGHSDAETATFATTSSRISLYNINMINTDNLDGLEPSYVTLAASIYGNDIAFYGCSFDGWQDTLLTGATAGYQYYESCYIGGAIDFIWGYSKAYFKGCTIGAKRKSSCVTAHNRGSSSAIGGYIFDQCLFTSAPGATDLINSVYLGRPYSQYALVVVKNSFLDKTIIPAGWKTWSATDPRTGGITFAEFNNSGPSNWENNAVARQDFGYATLLTSDTYSLSSVMDSTEWIDMTYWNSIMTPQPVIVVPSPTNITVNGTSFYNGTAPPAGALIVSKTPLNGVSTYSTIQAALDAASPSSKVNATIFIYPGVYIEQLIVNKSGHTIFQGYSEATDDFSKNQVTIQFDHGIDTQAPTGSNTDGATVYATGNYFHAFNINFRNNFGTTQNIASLAFAVKSSKYAALYGCQIYGNQDTLSISGSLFTFKTYVEGNVDFIYGSGSAYFLDSTIAPNEDGISITASKRTANTTSAGFVFDQCTLKPAAGTGPFANVGLGRPWNNLSRVAYIGCYFDSMISPAGWQQWSKSTPNTDGVQYGEYHNYGPGSNICKRATFSQQLSDASVVQYQLGNFFPITTFIDFSHVDTQPFSIGTGSAQTCGPISSAISASMVATPSTSALSSTITSSIPVVTAYTTTTIVEKLTASTLITAPDVTTTTFVKVTEILSISAIDVTKTSIEKATATTSITAPDRTLTATFVVTENVGLTITPPAITKTSVLKETITEGGATTKAPSTFTVQGTSTIISVYSSIPKATTVTQSQGSTIVVTSSIYPKADSTTVLTTISVEPSSTKTTTIKPKSSVTITTTSYKTTTKESTTTASCLPTAEAKRMVRRGAIVPRAIASTTTITLSATVTSFVKTSTMTQPGSTLFVTQTSTATKTTSLKASTTTSTITSIVATRTSTQAGQTYFTTVISTSQFGKTTTLKPSTMMVLSTSFATRTSLFTVTADAVTISNLKTKTSTQTVVVEQQTIFITKSADMTSTVKTTLPASTTTLYKTVTEGGGVVTETVTAAPSTKTVAQKVTKTVIQIATKTAKGAKVCTA
jgi:pectin methylesterase-like acyl-CoA thioesterase